jgi:hypothetical protein
VLVGCASNPALGSSKAELPSDGEVAAAVTGFGIGDIEQARKTYLLKCAKCHQFYHPWNYTESEWAGWMTKMAAKSKLTPAEEVSLRTYTEALRRLPPDARPVSAGTH